MVFDYKKRAATPIQDHPVGKLLDSLRMESAFYTDAKLTRPWAMEMPAMPNFMMYHLVIEGTAEFRVGGAAFVLKKDDFVLFPKGDGHILSDGSCKIITRLAELPIECVTERYERLSFGGDGEQTRMVCGAMVFQHPLAIKLLGILPPFITIDSGSADSSSVVNGITELLETESHSISVGAEAVISRLADILVIAAMRQYLAELEDSETGWLSALQDDRIGKALRLKIGRAHV